MRKKVLDSRIETSTTTILYKNLSCIDAIEQYKCFCYIPYGESVIIKLTIIPMKI